jgi:HEAT repeat protein
LRQALISEKDRSSRGAELTAKVAALKSMNDLHRALFLSEWQDHHPDPEVAIVDQKYRALVGKRFEQTIRPVLKSTDKALCMRSLEQLDAVATAQPEGCDPCKFMPALAGDLADLTRHGSAGMRERAAKVLGRWHADPEVAVPALGTLLVVGTLSERVTAAGSLTQVIEEAYRLANQDNAKMDKAAAARNLILSARGAIPALARGTKDKEPEVRHLSLVALTAIGRCCHGLVQAWDLTELDENPETARGQMEKNFADLLPLILQLGDQCKTLPFALSDSELEIRSDALQVIEELATLRLEWARRAKGLSAPEDPLRDSLSVNLPALARNLGDRQVTIRRKALEVLEYMGSAARASAPNVVRSLNDPDPFVRWAAARTLGKFAPAESTTAIPGLIKLLNETDTGIRVTAVSSLEKYGPAAKDAVPALIVKARADDAEMRACAIRALAAIAADSQTVAGCVQEAMKDPADLVRQTARDASARLRQAAQETGGMLSFHKPPVEPTDSTKTKDPVAQDKKP